MKITCFLIFGSVSMVAANVYSQSISLEAKQATLETIFSQIEQQSDYSFIYEQSDLAAARTVNVRLKKKPLEEAMRSILKDQALDFKIRDKFIVIFPRSRAKAAQDGPGMKTQQRVSGIVRDSTGTPIAGATVRVKGKTAGTSTDGQGRFSLEADAGETLQVTFIGFLPKEIRLGNEPSIEVTLQEETNNLQEVVVTALGVEREARTTTYSVQQVKGEELTKAKDPNLMNTLSGKVAGLNIQRNASGVGGSVKVVLRGNKSASGSNQALYVIDGVPMNNRLSTQSTTIFGGTPDGGDPISNLNPEDIASISILKGASAAALYGSQGQNGVVLITTKSGKAGKPVINFSSSATMDQNAYTPKFQNSYSASGAQSWGDEGSLAYHPDVNDFFGTGANFTNSLSLAAGTDQMQTYFSYANTTANGVEPDNKLQRHNVNFKETGSFFNNKLKVAANLNYIRQKIDNTPIPGLYFNPLVGLYLFPRGEDLNSYKDGFETYDPARNLMVQNWPYADDTRQQNPWWVSYRNPTSLNRNRYLVNASATYEVQDWLNLQARASMDSYNDVFEQRIFASTESSLAKENGNYKYNNSTFTQQYADFIANLKFDLGRFKISGLVGASIQDSYVKGVNFDGGDGLKYANQFTIKNFINLNPVSSGEVSPDHWQTQSVFASGSFGYDNWINLDLTARTDWTSTLAFTTNNPFFYPSAGINFILHDKLHLPSWVSFAKIRGSYAEVGNGVQTYLTNILNTYSGDATIPPTARSFTTLKPEKNKNIEIGTEWRFLDDRIRFDLSVYKTNTKNQLLTIRASQISGYDNFYVNAGDVQNKGIEASLSYQVIKRDELSWTSGLNFTLNRNKILELDPLLPQVELTGGDGYSSILKVGGSYGDIYGNKFQRDDQGRILVNVDDAGNASPLKSAEREYLGNPSPRAQAGWNNDLTYKRFSLSFLIDGSFGGDVLSLTQSYLDQYGVSEESGKARQNGGVAVNAVDQHGNGISKADAQSWYAIAGGRNGIQEAYMYDATVVRLRELSLGYSFPVKTGAIKNARLSATARNLFYFYKKAPFDPEVNMSSGNQLIGADLFMPPALRSIGLSLNLTF